MLGSASEPAVDTYLPDRTESGKLSITLGVLLAALDPDCLADYFNEPSSFLELSDWYICLTCSGFLSMSCNLSEGTFDAVAIIPK